MDTYVEYSYKMDVSLRQKLFRALLIALAVIFGFYSIFVPIFIPVTLLWIVLAVYYQRSLNCEYEYILCDSELQIDRIINKAKRKHVETFNMDQLEAMEVAKPHFFEDYKDKKVKVRRFYSSYNDDQVYGLMLKAGGLYTCLMLQANDKLVNALTLRYPHALRKEA